MERHVPDSRGLFVLRPAVDLGLPLNTESFLGRTFDQWCSAIDADFR